MTMNETNLETAIFGAGCFWGVEEVFRQLTGVSQTEVGYAGGHTENPTYQEVCSKTTGHAEVVRLHYDPAQVSYDDLLSLFWQCHDPTQVNRQGPDIGDQYRTVIFYTTEEQRRLAEVAKATLEASGQYSKPIATLIQPAPVFYRAEAYHQQYVAKQGGGVCHL